MPQTPPGVRRRAPAQATPSEDAFKTLLEVQGIHLPSFIKIRLKRA